jgi:hypothetical protein
MRIPGREQSVCESGAVSYAVHRRAEPLHVGVLTIPGLMTSPLSAIARSRPGNGPRAGSWDKNAPSSAVALNCGMGSSVLNVLVKAFDRLHIVRGRDPVESTSDGDRLEDCVVLFSWPSTNAA